MLSSISPLGERARTSRWGLTTTAYLVSSLAGGLVLGAVAALLGGLLPEPWRSSPVALAVVAVALLAGVVLDLRSGGHGVPSWRRQVDVAWLDRYRGWVMGLGFGAQLGFGLVTIVTSTTTYAVVVLAALGGDLPTGLAIGGVFGLVRALPSLFMARVVDRDALRRVFIRVERWAKPADIAARVALTGAAVVVGAAAVATVTGSG